MAANVDDAQTTNVEGEKALGYAIVANFISAKALTSELRDRRVLGPGEVGVRNNVLSKPNSSFWRQLGLGAVARTWRGRAWRLALEIGRAHV